jgi:hypothetical protein
MATSQELKQVASTISLGRAKCVRLLSLSKASLSLRKCTLGFCKQNLDAMIFYFCQSSH